MSAITDKLRQRRVPVQVIRENRWLIGLVLVHAGAAVIVGTLLDKPVVFGVTGLLSTLFALAVPIFVMILILRSFLYAVIWVRPERPLSWFLSEMRRSLIDGNRLLGGSVRLLVFIFFAAVFTYLKSVIPLIQEFSWDPAFARLDWYLHGGKDPYELTMAVFGTPLATAALNLVYGAWLFLVYLVVFLACFAIHDAVSRNTFLCAFVLTWAIGGNFLATVFSSAGPVFYEQLGFGTTFRPLVATLRHLADIGPLESVSLQSTLWQGYSSGDADNLISAMPSMHLASSTLMALYGFTYARWAGISLTVFTGLMLVGSVHLGWHYAVDSYAGIALALIGWKLGAVLAARQHRADS